MGSFDIAHHGFSSVIFKNVGLYSIVRSLHLVLPFCLFTKALTLNGLSLEITIPERYLNYASKSNKKFSADSSRSLL